MNERYPLNKWSVNFVQRGEGRPVILIHGLAASHHDWDDLLPVLEREGYCGYALDLLGHGESAKPASRSYELNWMLEHLSAWMDSLDLHEPAVLIGHSLGGYLSLEYARRFSARVRGLVLVNPFYRLSQLPALLRFSYRRPAINMAVVEHTPEWLFRLIVDATSLSMGNSNGGSHNLPAHIRAQTALDYKLTAAGVYNLPNTLPDFTPWLHEIMQPTAVIWGSHDSTLSPASFGELVSRLPNVIGSHSLPSGHVPHQSHPVEFRSLVLEFMRRADADEGHDYHGERGGM